SSGGLVTLAGDGDRALHERELFRTVRLAQALEQTPPVLELDAESGGGLAQRRDVVAIVLERGRREDGEAACLPAQLEQHVVAFAPANSVHPELVLERRAERIARPRPAFRLRVARAQIEGGLDELALRVEHDPAAVLVHAGQ